MHHLYCLYIVCVMFVGHLGSSAFNKLKLKLKMMTLLGCDKA